MRIRNVIMYVTLSAIVLLGIVLCNAADLLMVNPSFETPVLSQGQTQAGAMGWTFVAGGTGTSVATWYPPSGTFSSIPDGKQIVELTATRSPGFTTPELQQTVGTLNANTVYTLAVDIGARSDWPTGGYWAGLQVAGQSLAYTHWDPARPLSSIGPKLTSGSFTPVVVSEYSDGLPTGAVGQPMLLRLAAIGTPVGASQQKTCFDNVRVTSIPRSEVGEINGSVSLSDFYGDSSLVPVKVDLLMGESVLASTFDRQYRLIGVAPGTYSLAFNTAQFLKKVVPDIEVTAGGTVTLPAVTLVNGDIDGDNTITTTDFSTLLMNATTQIGADIEIVSNGSPNSTIILDPNASTQAQEAAKELQIYITRMSGATLPISTNSAAPGNKIFVGRGTAVNNMGLPLQSGVTSQFNEEGYVVDCTENRLVLAGNETPPYEGTYYAVSDFLESLGCRWYMAGEFGEVVASQTTIVAPYGRRVCRPVFRLRDFWPNGQVWPVDVQAVYKWGRRNRFVQDRFIMNPTVDLAPYVQSPVDYSIERLVPFATYGTTHPEYYVGGDRYQPNLNLPAVKQIARDTIRDFFAENPTALSYGFAGPDYPNAIGTDATSQALYRGGYGNEGYGILLGGTTGMTVAADVSDTYWDFMKYLSSEIYSSHPNRLLLSLAYDNRVRPPEGVESPWPNTVVVIAPYRQDMLRPYSENSSPINRRYWAMIKRWSELAAGIAYWEYEPNDFHNLMRPCWRSEVIRTNLKLLHDLNGWGFSLETPFGGMMIGLNHYIYGKLSWDIDADPQAMISEFCDKFFGPAAEPMRQYYTYVENTMLETPIVPNWTGDDPAFFEIYNQAFRQQCQSLLNQAAALATAEPYTRRVFVFNQHFRRLNAFCEMHTSMNNGDYQSALAQYDVMKDAVTQVNDPLLLQHGNRWPDWMRNVASAVMPRINGTQGSMVAILPQTAAFKTDPDVEGVTFGWPRLAEAPPDWKPIRLDATWGAQGITDRLGRSYVGAAWYHIPLTLTAEQVSQPLTLCMPAVYRQFDEVWVWVNGNIAGHKTTQFFEVVDIPLGNRLKPGSNTIVIRFNADGGPYIRPFLYR